MLEQVVSQEARYVDYYYSIKILIKFILYQERKNFSRTHPNLFAASLSYITIQELHKISKNLDCIFLCTKSNDSYNLTIKLLKENIKIIDLSGAFRFDDINKYKKAYGSIKKINKLLLKKKNCLRAIRA